MAGSAFCLYVFGRLAAITPQRLAAVVEGAGGRLAPRPGSKVDLVAVAHSTARTRLVRARADLPGGLPENVRAVSEGSLRRMLGLSPPLDGQPRTLSAEDLARGARLDTAVVRCLALYDVLEPEAGLFGYRDLLLARDVARLLASGLSLDRIIAAAITLRRSGAPTASLRLTEAPWDEIVEEIAGSRASLGGQFVLPLDDAPPSVDAVFENAEAAEAEGDPATAERLYRLALLLDRNDPVIPFNLGNVLDGLGRETEAVIAYAQALSRDPAFAEAWLNVGILHQHRQQYGRPRVAIAALSRRRPDYAEAIRALALLLTRSEHYDETVPLWGRYLRLQPPPRDLASVRELALACRMMAGRARPQCDEGAYRVQSRRGGHPRCSGQMARLGRRRGRVDSIDDQQGARRLPSQNRRRDMTACSRVVGVLVRESNA